MSDQGGKEHKIGMTIGIIAMKQLPTKWVAYMDKWRSCIPGGIFWNFEYVIGKYYDEARNEVIERARKNNSKWVFFIDSDVFIPYDGLIKLLSHNKKITTGIYWTKTNPSHPVIFEELGNGPIFDVDNKGGIFEIGGAGLGCTLIDMDVFDKFDEAEIPYFKCDWEYWPTKQKKIKVAVGEDHYFFIKARELGFEVWCDPDIRCGHYEVNADKMYPGSNVMMGRNKSKIKKAAEMFGYKEDKSKPKVVFYQSQGIPMNGHTNLEKPLGGTETDLINMSREMHRLGCNVEVYCRCDAEGVYDGVLYNNLDKFNPREHSHIFIANRDVDILKEEFFKIDADQKYIWGHDVGQSPAWNNIEDAYLNIDGIITVSKFHADTILEAHPEIDNKKIIVSENGVDNEKYEKTNQEGINKNQLIYTSTPFRGLDILLDAFPIIKEQVPDATLEVYTGMSLYHQPELDEKFKKLYDKIETMDGVNRYEPIPQKELAHIQMNAHLLAYPCTFPETFCVTAAEAITARTPVVATKTGALPETVGDCGVLIDISHGDRVKFVNDFAFEVVKILKDESIYNKLIENCCDRDFGWDSLAIKWLDSMLGEDWKNKDFSPKKESKEEDKTKVLKDFASKAPNFLSDAIKYVDNIFDGSKLLYLGKDKKLFKTFMGKYKPNCQISTSPRVDPQSFDYVILDRSLEGQSSMNLLLEGVHNTLKPEGDLFIITELDIKKLEELIKNINGLMTYESEDGKTIAIVKFKGGK